MHLNHLSKYLGVEVERYTPIHVQEQPYIVFDTPRHVHIYSDNPTNDCTVSMMSAVDAINGKRVYLGRSLKLNAVYKSVDEWSDALVEGVRLLKGNKLQVKFTVSPDTTHIQNIALSYTGLPGSVNVDPIKLLNAPDLYMFEVIKALDKAYNNAKRLDAFD